MRNKMDLGFESQKRELDYPFKTTIRCGDDTMKHLLDIKQYCSEHIDTPPESTSGLIRKAIQFGSVFCQIQASAQDMEKPEKVKK